MSTKISDCGNISAKVIGQHAAQ